MRMIPFSSRGLPSCEQRRSTALSMHTLSRCSYVSKLDKGCHLARPSKILQILQHVPRMIANAGNDHIFESICIVTKCHDPCFFGELTPEGLLIHPIPTILVSESLLYATVEAMEYDNA